MLIREQLSQASTSAGGSCSGDGAERTPERTSALVAELSRLQVSSSAAVKLALWFGAVSCACVGAEDGDAAPPGRGQTEAGEPGSAG